ncbi:MAG: hypothetical protein Q8O88_01040 [bacterium]|nr:hypothetical protein [bacterium]
MEKNIDKLLDEAENKIQREIEICRMKYPSDKTVQQHAHGQVDGIIRATKVIFQLFGREFPKKPGN